MRILICPDSFKDCLPAPAVAAALARGFQAACPDALVRLAPLADGGEGTTAALIAATGGQWHEAVVTGPLGAPVTARFGLLGDAASGDGVTAVLEMAAASGLELVPRDRRDPRVTTTRGTGELLRAALDLGVRRVLLGIGGSATNDGGAGLAQALGVRCLDAAGHDLPPGGAALARLARVVTTDLDPRLAGVEVLVACDVENPLCGPHGASAVYGPQKGASRAVVAELDAALAHWARVLARDLGRDVADLPGAGAAGGLGAGLVAFCGATLRPGIDLVLDAVGFDALLADSDLVLTGEGQIDASTLHGKTIAGVLRRARAAGVPVVAVAGAVTADLDDLHAAGLTAAVPLLDRPMSLETALAEGERLLVAAGRLVAQLSTVANRAGPDRRPERRCGASPRRKGCA
jgi:glycerate kinase